MNLRKATVLAMSLILAVGLLASYARAQSDPSRGEGARISADESRAQQLQELAERVAALKKEIEASQRPPVSNQPDRELLERLRQRRTEEVRAGQPANALAPKPEAEGLRVIINGQEVKLGEGKMVFLGEGNPAAAKSREEQERLEQAERAMKPNPAPQRGRAEGGKEGQDGVTFTISGMELKVGEGGKVGEGRLVVVPEGKPGQPAPGGMKPLPPGNPWVAVPGANPARPGAPAGQGGAVFVIREGQERGGPAAEEREAQERREAQEARERRDGGGFRLNVVPQRVDPLNPAPRAPGATAWGQPMPGAPAPGQPVRPNVAAAQMQELGQMMAMLHTFKEISFDPETAAMVAIGGIKDENPRQPGAAIKVLESTLRKTRTVGLRTAIHMSLKDLYKAQGNEEMALEHLRDMVLENDEALQEHNATMTKRGGEKDEPSFKGKSGGKKDKHGDDDEKDED